MPDRMEALKALFSCRCISRVCEKFFVLQIFNNCIRWPFRSPDLNLLYYLILLSFEGMRESIE